MVSDTSNCDRERLRMLLEHNLPRSVELDLMRHIETCVGCRHQLESFAADERWWTGTRNALSGVSDSSGAWSLEEPNHHSENGSSSIPLDFLAPSDNPAMLGRLGEFEILELIGCGGMGIVLKGYDQELNRYIAVKVLHPHCATSAAARRRFAREAQAAAAVVHQHVVAIHAVDANHHPPYLVMSFVPGESLQQRLTRQGPFEVIDVLRIAQQVAEGLAAAHAQGLVHRDIKPGNILLERNVERVLLTDFGLARAADDASLTQSGVIAGTPQYMSPEQTRGEQVDHRTDLFSLGTVMYTLLAGHSPFRAETALGVLRRVCDDTPRPVREINANVPAWLEAFINKLQAKQPSQRFETAKEVAELLKKCVAHVQQPMQLPLPLEVARLVIRKRKKRRIFPTLAWSAGVLLIVAMVCVVAGPSRTIEERPVRTDPSTSPSRTIGNSNIVMDWNDDHKKVVIEIQRSIERLESESADKF